MNSRYALRLQQSDAANAGHGSWKLQPARALTLGSGTGGLLVVECGEVWATLDGPHQGPANDWGDRVLHRGDQLQLMPGQHVVLEVFGAAANEAAFLCWAPASAPASKRTEALFGVLASGTAILGNALSWLIAGRGQVLSPLQGNQP